MTDRLASDLEMLGRMVFLNDQLDKLKDENARLKAELARCQEELRTLSKGA